jgi:hypothetical protein
LCLITYRRLAQSILLFHRYLLFIILQCCLHSMIFLMSRTESILKLYSIAQCTKFPFQRVFIFPIGLRTRELRLVYFGDEICPEISERATLNVFYITPCTGLQTCWFLMRWNGNLMELLYISFSPFVHL